MPTPHLQLSSHRDFDVFLSCFTSLDDYQVRRRSWGPMQAMMSVFALCEPGAARAYADGCQQMFAWVGSQLGLKAVPAQSGLARARSQVTDSDLALVWSMATTWTNARAADVERLIPGRPLIGCDGTTLIMRRSASHSASYGIRRDRDGNELSHYPEALLTSCWDLDTRMPLCWRMQSVLAKGGERAMAKDMFAELPERSILVMDAGYPARDMLGAIMANGHDLVIRMVAAQQGSWPEVQQFLKSKKKSAVIDTIIEQNRKRRVVPMRYIRRTFSRGRPQDGQTRTLMVVVTSLIDDKLTDEHIISIYQGRWTIETIHDELKNLSNLETWHSTTKQGVEQEMLCHMLWNLLAGHIASHLEAEHRAANPGRIVRANTPRMMSAVKDIADWLLESVGQHEAVQEFLRGKAQRRLDAARKGLVTRRKRKSRSRVAFHPYAKPRRNHGN